MGRDNGHRLLNGMSGVVFGAHWLLLIVAVLFFLGGLWRYGLATVGVAVALTYFSYRLVGGKRNPVIWKDKHLFDVLRYATDTRQA